MVEIVAPAAGVHPAAGAKISTILRQYFGAPVFITGM